MGASSSIMKPQELTEFRKLNTSAENVEIPARPESRTVTDKKGFLIFGIAILIFIPFFGYALAKSDIRRYFYGYDACGNMCGFNNSKIDGITCSGKDYKLRPYLKSNVKTSNIDEFLGNSNVSSHCVAQCEPGEISGFMKKCSNRDIVSLERSRNNKFPKRIRRSTSEKTLDMKEVLQSCRTNWWKFVLSIIITIALCMFILFLLRFSPGVVIWGVLIISMLAAIILTGGLWYAYFNTLKDKRDPILVLSVILTIFTLIIILIFLCLFKKIRLVVQLYKEATKAVFAMPLLILVPIVVTIIQIITLVLFFSSNAWLITSREFNKISDEEYKYQISGVMIFTIVFNVIMTSWTMHFVTGLQYMVISGSVAAWYFAKNKQYLDAPICTSIHNAFKFHVGTVAFGSSILIIMDIIRALIRALVNNDKLRCVLECCCENVEAFLKFLSKNAYIETSIHGQSFLRSGKRAAKLLLTNAASVIAINSVGDFVLGMVIFVLLCISTGISVTLFMSTEHFWFPSVICFFINIVIISFTFAIFETTIDTLFICFCEDKVINDGLSKPYYMSRGLMEFVENSKKVYGNKDQP